MFNAYDYEDIFFFELGSDDKNDTAPKTPPVLPAAPRKPLKFIQISQSEKDKLYDTVLSPFDLLNYGLLTSEYIIEKFERIIQQSYPTETLRKLITIIIFREKNIKENHIDRTERKKELKELKAELIEKVKEVEKEAEKKAELKAEQEAEKEKQQAEKEKQQNELFKKIELDTKASIEKYHARLQQEKQEKQEKQKKQKKQKKPNDTFIAITRRLQGTSTPTTPPPTELPLRKCETPEEFVGVFAWEDKTTTSPDKYKHTPPREINRRAAATPIISKKSKEIPIPGKKSNSTTPSNLIIGNPDSNRFSPKFNK